MIKRPEGLIFNLTDEQLAIKELDRGFTNREIKPVALEFEKDPEGKLAEEIFKKAAQVGILQLPIPVEYEGIRQRNGNEGDHQLRAGHGLVWIFQGIRGGKVHERRQDHSDLYRCQRVHKAGHHRGARLDGFP